ncbi:MAG TPA: TraR/DksA family transcriptional regulator [Bryobacteraceae bacterium]|nr:TraR/DksA family transcriptional regulator [Bryobacteraceae bacterium]
MTTRSTTGAETKRRKETLESKLKGLLGSSLLRDELRIDSEPDALDRVRSHTDRDMAVQRLNQDTRLIRDIQSAMARIKAGSYGCCGQCGEPIPGKRLDAIPWCSLCLDCQSKMEVFKDAA